REALVKALVRAPHLVLTELRLPLMDGFALCEILRRDRATLSTPIMVVTNDTNPTDVQRAIAAGADVVLAKRSRLEALVEEVQRLLDRCRRISGRIEESRGQTNRVLAESAAAVSHSRLTRARLSKSYQRTVTTSPANPPPTLQCANCDRRLRYLMS